ncbi:type III-A CRISPR-associated protein Cas10/Csm1 [candidate division Kazan bacterium]|uniref:CRISPR system single-strand-specific deoxyribonuclease Cas10/Csm1 (subtype III-A) n=1 Tax=candidate division Kazan bacterium TaxID=2202143 RepID=A0A420ZCK7_UNCK3|nr:MAG: type III-A CRISPR-associated protein Cas10/Csm1 [candidate division Kazan bacterium]
MIKISDEEKELVLGALLHDIGKLTYLLNEKPITHQKSGSIFFFNLFKNYKIIGEGLGAIKQRILMHHDKTTHPLSTIIKEADRLSAGERADYDGEEDNTQSSRKRKKALMIPVFTEINLGKNNAKMKWIKLTTIKDYELTKKEPESLIKDYAEIKSILEKDIRETAKIEDFKKFVDTLNYILMKNLRLVPSATYYSKPDISLYDHLKTTAAIALCLYRTQHMKTDERFLLIGGDVSGIQDFIFYSFRTSESDEHAAKRLRGRSIFINLLVDAVAAYIKDSLNLYEFNILWASGGNFVILAPNTEENIKSLEKIRVNVNRHLFNKYGNIYVNISWVRGKKDDVSEFSVFLNKLRAQEKKDKKRKWYFDLETIFKDGIDEKQLKEDEVCPVCGRRKAVIIENEKKPCETCLMFEQIGSDAVRYSFILTRKNEKWETDENNTVSFEFGDYKRYYRISNELKGSDFVYSVNFFDVFVGKNMGWGFKLLGNYIPSYIYADVYEIFSFDKIVDVKGKMEDRKSPEKEGKPSKLAVFKADVDNLGLIFSIGLKRNEEKKEKDLRKISRITQLSFLLDYFFSIKINKLARNHNIYVLFSGGDDLTVAGRYDEIINFVKDVQENFKNWVCENSDITISGGIEMAGYKFPISRLVDCAEFSLENSKNQDKNGVTLFGIYVRWDMFNRLYRIYDNLFKSHLKDEKISSGLLYKLLKIYENTEYNKELDVKRTHFALPNPDPYVKYFVVRSWKSLNEEEKRKCDEFIQTILERDVFANIKIPISLSSLYNRYFRKKEGVNK